MDSFPRLLLDTPSLAVRTDRVSSMVSKGSVADCIASKDGEVISSVTEKCNCIVIGECNSEAYSMGNYEKQGQEGA